MFCTSGDFWWIPAGFHQLSMSNLISGHQCNLTMTVMSSWIHTTEVMKQNVTMSLPALQMDNSDKTVVSGSKSYPQSWCHMPTLFWEISKISHVLHLWWLFGEFQQGFANFLCLTWSAVISVTQLWQSCPPEVDTSKVMKQNVAMSFPALQMDISDMTVVLDSKNYPQSWCHMPTLFWEINEISQVLHLWWLLVNSSRVSPTFYVWHDQ